MATQYNRFKMMNERKLSKYLKALQENELFCNLSTEKLENFLAELEEEVWPKYTCSISKNKALYKFHIIISGRLKIYQTDPGTGREFTLYLLTKNDAFDILCLLDEVEHHTYYETLDDVKVLSIPIEKMRQWIRQNPEINKPLLKYMGKQMRSLEEYASNITLIDISTRLAKLILNNINNKSQKLEMINDLSNEELANLIGSTRAVVNRHLQDFKSDGIISVGRKKVEIKNLQLLLDKIEKRAGQ
ncbi:Crp/Fnr family transcriptional regulator [Salegentibacter chungangensis]|uniref:Crp/Fnr family transcriptional regulator n=1 Tax=Salegentibacter chungangensis TaxID=1335724 RepID=A0ABW3NSZ5_9FLAO